MTAWICVFAFCILVLTYTHIGYPGLMSALAWGGRPRRSTPGVWPTVTLIIPAHNEEEILAAKLDNALAMDYPRDRLGIVVASDGSDDRTVPIAQQYESQGVRLLEFHERRGKATVVNDALAAAADELVLLCDANVLFQPDALQRMVERLADPTVGAVSGDVRLASQDSNFGSGELVYYRLERRVQLGESRIGSMMGVDGGMYLVRKELYDTTASDTILDDFVISMKVIRRGARIVYEPAAIANESGTPRAMQEFRRRVRIAVGAVQSVKRRHWPPLSRPVELWQYLSHKLLRWLSPIFLLLLLGSSGFLWGEGALYRAVILGQIAIYALAAVATVSERFRRIPVGGIPFYLVMSHIAQGVGLLKGLFAHHTGMWNRTERTPARGAPAAADAPSAQ